MRNVDRIKKALLTSTYEVEIDLISDWNAHLNDKMLKMDMNLR